MRTLFIIVYCVISITANAQTEKLNTFHLVDKASNKPVVTSVAIMKARLSITTEKDGIFAIPGDLSKMTDSIIFSAQNYQDIKMSLRALSKLDTIKLTKTVLKQTIGDSKFAKNIVLNNFNEDDIAYFAGVHEDTSAFNYLQLAQQFYTDKVNTELVTLQIERLSYNLDDKYGVIIYNEPKLEHFKQIEFTKFKVRIYDINEATSKPGKDLCDSVIEVKIRSSEKARINLKNYHIIIPHKTFFVAIEWIRDYYNAHYTVVFKPPYHHSTAGDKLISYKPAIGISPVTGQKLNIWSLDTNHDWLPYTTFSPFGTDLAIKATLGYN
jgi:hypothetical protein